MKNTIWHIAIPVPLRQYFDYLPPLSHDAKNVVLGARVKVPFGKREVIGILIGTSQTSTINPKKLKRVHEILDAESIFSPTLFKLGQWASDYYHHPLGEVLSHMLPTLLRKGKILAFNKAIIQPKIAESMVFFELNQKQKEAVEKIKNTLNQFQTFLLNGVTGSGKTEVYLEVIDHVLKQGKQALVLVPEIGLTPQTVKRFEDRFSVPMVVLHSKITERERLDAWIRAKQGEISIVIGTRSALFTPLSNLGVIIVDEEHDLSFKQQEGFRYHARDMAIMRGQYDQVPVILGSATPSLETFSKALENRYQLLELPERAGLAVHPKFHLIDLRQQVLENGLSQELLWNIEKHLKNKGQILLFLNRRGFSPVLMCRQCSWIPHCKRCDVKLTYHQNPYALLCHHCGANQKLPEKCPECREKALFPVGLGTQRLEETLIKYFPEVGIVRIDRDSTKQKGSLQNLLSTVHDGKNRILIGTQMLAKGHHFPEVTLVAILDADSGIFSSDFRATERTAQLLIQVAGRAGRADRPGEVAIQTYHPNHPLLLNLITEGYGHFVESALGERQAALLPPYAHLALLRAESVSKNYPMQFLTEVLEFSKSKGGNEVRILGPVPTVIEKRVGKYRAQLLFQSQHRKFLHSLLEKVKTQIPVFPSLKRVRWTLDIDPQEIT